jgi:DNA-binding transcriptional LysR family regulator
MSSAVDAVISSSFGQLRAFVAVGETLSFSRAAEALGVSPSALSQMVRGFEAGVGVRLFNRTTRSVSLTDAGERLFQRVRPAMAELGEAIGQVRHQGERPSGVVRVVSFHSAAELYLRPMLAGFHAAYPDVVLDISLDDAVSDFVGGGFDVALRLGEVIETPRDLVDHRCIRWRWPGTTTPYHWEFWQDGDWFEVAVDGPLIVSDKAMALAAALDGIGIAFAVDHRVERHIAEGRLVPLLEAWSAPFPGLFLAYPRQRQMAPALRAFIDHVRAAAGVQGEP